MSGVVMATSSTVVFMVGKSASGVNCACGATTKIGVGVKVLLWGRAGGPGQGDRGGGREGGYHGGQRAGHLWRAAALCGRAGVAQGAAAPAPSPARASPCLIDYA